MRHGPWFESRRLRLERGRLEGCGRFGTWAAPSVVMWLYVAGNTKGGEVELNISGRVSSPWCQIYTKPPKCARTGPSVVRLWIATSWGWCRWLSVQTCRLFLFLVLFFSGEGRIMQGRTSCWKLIPCSPEIYRLSENWGDSTNAFVLATRQSCLENAASRQGFRLTMEVQPER